MVIASSVRTYPTFIFEDFRAGLGFAPPLLPHPTSQQTDGGTRHVRSIDANLCLPERRVHLPVWILVTNLHCKLVSYPDGRVAMIQVAPASATELRASSQYNFDPARRHPRVL